MAEKTSLNIFALSTSSAKAFAKANKDDENLFKQQVIHAKQDIREQKESKTPKQESPAVTKEENNSRAQETEDQTTQTNAQDNGDKKITTDKFGSTEETEDISKKVVKLLLNSSDRINEEDALTDELYSNSTVDDALRSIIDTEEILESDILVFTLATAASFESVRSQVEEVETTEEFTTEATEEEGDATRAETGEEDIMQAAVINNPNKGHDLLNIEAETKQQTTEHRNTPIERKETASDEVIENSKTIKHENVGVAQAKNASMALPKKETSGATTDAKKQDTVTADTKIVISASDSAQDKKGFLTKEDLEQKESFAFASKEERLSLDTEKPSESFTLNIKYTANTNIEKNINQGVLDIGKLDTTTFKSIAFQYAAIAKNGQHVFFFPEQSVVVKISFDEKSQTHKISIGSQDAATDSAISANLGRIEQVVSKIPELEEVYVEHDHNPQDSAKYFSSNSDSGAKDRDGFQGQQEIHISQTDKVTKEAKHTTANITSREKSPDHIVYIEV